MNMIAPFFTRLLAGLVLSSGVLLAPAVRAEDGVDRFVKTELGIDLSRYKLGASVTNFPESTPGVAAANAESPWRRVPIQRPTPHGTNVTDFAELRFVDDRLVEVQTHVGDFSKASPGAENTRRLATFQKLGAKPLTANPSSYFVDTDQGRIRVEGFCSTTNPILLRFNIRASKPGEAR